MQKRLSEYRMAGNVLRLKKRVWPTVIYNYHTFLTHGPCDRNQAPNVEYICASPFTPQSPHSFSKIQGKQLN